MNATGRKEKDGTRTRWRGEALVVSIAVSIALALALTACASPWENDSAALAAQDSPTALRIKSALIEAPGLAGAAIDVVFVDGQATLTGFVESEAQRRRAAEITRGQAGVEEVANEIKIK